MQHLGIDFPLAVALSAPAARISDYLLKPGDALQITVAGENELGGLYPVRSDGTVWFQLVGAVPAAGLVVPVFQESLRQRPGGRISEVTAG